MFYANTIAFYKQIVFTPDCAFSGANAPYTVEQVNSIISQRNTNLSLYYLLTELDTLINNYYTNPLVYNKTGINTNFTLFLQSEIVTVISNAYTKALVYNKTEVGTWFSLYYSKTERDTLINHHYTQSLVYNMIEIGTFSPYYLNSEVDTLINNYYTNTSVCNKPEIDSTFHFTI